MNVQGCDDMFEYNWQNNSHYNRFREACKHVDNDRTMYIWRIKPVDSGSRFYTIKEGQSVFHANGASSKILEPIFFKPGDQIQCSTTAVGTNGQQGVVILKNTFLNFVWRAQSYLVIINIYEK